MKIGQESRLRVRTEVRGGASTQIAAAGAAVVGGTWAVIKATGSGAWDLIGDAGELGG
jgi:hypothetical protein